MTSWVQKSVSHEALLNKSRAPPSFLFWVPGQVSRCLHVTRDLDNFDTSPLMSQAMIVTISNNHCISIITWNSIQSLCHYVCLRCLTAQPISLLIVLIGTVLAISVAQRLGCDHVGLGPRLSPRFLSFCCTNILIHAMCLCMYIYIYSCMHLLVYIKKKHRNLSRIK